MEIGPLSEWVGAFAEFLTVLVALFLPYYQAKKASKAEVTRMKRFLLVRCYALINDNVDLSKKKSALENLKEFIHIGFMFETNSINLKLLEYANNIVSIYEKYGNNFSLKSNPIESETVLNLMKKIEDLH